MIFNSILLVLGLASAADLSSVQINMADGKPLQWSAYKGKPMMIVNIATQCGYTPQLAGLQKVQKDYAAKGLVVLGVPSNDFGGQTPEDSKQVSKFCLLHYGVSFPLTEKVTVLGSNKHPLAQYLLAEAPSHEEIGWNFEKFLLNSQGKVVARFKSGMEPQSPEMQAALDKLLKTQ
jgi:glutathione peroxidase